jgi:hypothetical protein
MPSSKQALTTPSGRPAAFGNRVRDRINSTKIVNKLQAHVDGSEDMTQTQIQAARILLDRTVPVLKAKEVNGGDDVNIKTITNAQLFDALEGECERK